MNPLANSASNSQAPPARLAKAFGLCSRFTRGVRGHMFDRVNGWQRIGIVLSVLWLAGSGVFVAKTLASSSTDTWFVSVLPAHCQPGAPKLSERPSGNRRGISIDELDEYLIGCKSEYIIPAVSSPNWGAVSILVLGPIAALWAIACALVAIVRWIAVGFVAQRNKRAP